VRQPSDIGPVLFSNTSPTYALLQPVSQEASGGGGGDGDDSNTGLIVAIVVIGLLVVGGGAFLIGRRGSVEDRE
jgi:hypothetical protein